MSGEGMTLTEFLRARLNDDEERARFVQREQGDRARYGTEPWRLSWHDEVIASPFVPDDQVFVVDEHAVDAATREAAHKDHRAAMRRLAAETAWQARHCFAGQLADPRAAFRITGL